MTKNKKIVISALPFVALIALFAIFCGIVSSKGYRLDMYIKIIFNEGIVLSIVATGAIFIYTLGSFDISLGAATLFAATLGVVSYNRKPWSDDACYPAFRNWMFTFKFSACVTVSHSGVCHNCSDDVRAVSYSFTDNHYKGWCCWWNKYSKCGSKTNGYIGV